MPLTVVQVKNVKPKEKAFKVADEKGLYLKAIKKIEEKLSPQEFEKFISSTEYMPAWMSNAVLQYKNLKETECA
jgi:hypothetical protein